MPLKLRTEVLPVTTGVEWCWYRGSATEGEKRREMLFQKRCPTQAPPVTLKIVL